MPVTNAPPFTIRVPYVGAGAHGARRSATVDREEADTLAAGHPRREALLASAAVWDEQADWLALHAGCDPFDGGPAR